MLAFKLLFVLNGLWLLVNFALSLRNLRWQKEERLLFIQAESLVKEAEETLLQVQSNEFKVCPTCGKIIQGMCLRCATGAVPCNVDED